MKKITFVVGVLQFFIFGLLIFLNSEINYYFLGYNPPWLKKLTSDNLFYFNGFLCLSSLLLIRISNHNEVSLVKKPKLFLFFMSIGFMLSSAILLAWIAKLILNQRIAIDTVLFATLLLAMSSLFVSLTWVHSLVRFIHQK